MENGGDGIVVDACIMRHFFLQAETRNGNYFRLIKYLLRVYRIAVDNGGKIEQEWCEQGIYEMISAWITDQIKTGKIIALSASLGRGKINKIFHEYGLDRTEKDIEYIKVANVTAFKYILSEDIHFYDPKKKQANHITKEKIKNRRNGRLQKYLAKELKITVASLRHLKCDRIVPDSFIVPDYPL